MSQFAGGSIIVIPSRQRTEKEIAERRAANEKLLQEMNRKLEAMREEQGNEVSGWS
ncbi:hypothetical protein [Desertibacillus haloalkaliphilus]|uniref:hypothetical protein n=1 Tax=Desertibacillus haloalkaliphilus TaxID=1328930 RepID=UPI001C2724EA|nr:hypothetical protein [Desertibacillus haloalkaliphilus]MBU8908540.1 hypothetical protein [Desertibacillus haloalkaliphilus]